MYRYRLLITNAILLLTLLGSHLGRRIEDITIPDPAFLSRLNLPFRDWQTQDTNLKWDEEKILEPDAVLVRRYRSEKGETAELVVIAGHRKRTVHTPGYCMVGGGWEFLSQRPCDLRVPGGSIPAMRTLLGRDDGRKMVATYFFTDGAYSTRNVVQLQGRQLLQRLRSEIPLGALVRIIVPVSTDPAAAEKLSDEFAQATVPGVLASLRHARLQVR